MKRKGCRVIASFFSLFGLAILLQSCFVWETAVYWRSTGISKEVIAHQQPMLEIHKRGQGFFILPFLFVTYGVGGYRINFRMYNKKVFNGIDSVRYSIINKQRRVYSGILIPKIYSYNTKGRAKGLERMRADGDTIRLVSFSTRLQGFSIATRADSVRVNFDVFMTDSSRRVQVVKYRNCQLMREGRKFGSML